MVRLLYVSRCYGTKDYGVVDTDDGVETIISYSDLRDAVMKFGIEVIGVEVIDDTNGVDIQIWQNPAECTRVQSKYLVLYGLDVKIHNDTIVDVKSAGLRKDSVRLRLSDLASKCGSRAFRSLILSSRNEVIIVVDDKVELDATAFRGLPSNRAMRMDVSEVTREDLIESFYMSLDSMQLMGWYLSYIIDDSARRDYYIGVNIVRGTCVGDKRDIQALGTMREVARKVADRFRGTFTEFVHSEFVIPPGAYSVLIRDYMSLNTTKRALCYIKSGQLSFDFCKKHFKSLLDILVTTAVVDDQMYEQFRRFATYFDIPEDIQVLVVQFVTRVVKFYESYYNSLEDDI